MNKDFLLRTALITTAALTPAVTLAAAPNYTYVDVGYVSADIDEGPTADGFGIDGSARLSNEIHLVADYMFLGENDIDLDLYRVGLGYNQSLTQTTDFVVRGGWAGASVDVDLPNGRSASDTDNGWFAQTGIRSMLSEELELSGFLTYTDTTDSTTSVDLGAAYALTPMIGIILDASFSDDANVYEGGVRFTF